MVRTKHCGVKEELNKDVESNEQQKAKAQDGRHHTVQKEPAKEVGTLSGFSNITDTIQETDIYIAISYYCGTFTDAGQEPCFIPYE